MCVEQKNKTKQKKKNKRCIHGIWPYEITSSILSLISCQCNPLQTDQHYMGYSVEYFQEQIRQQEKHHPHATENYTFIHTHTQTLPIWWDAFRFMSWEDIVHRHSPCLRQLGIRDDVFTHSPGHLSSPILWRVHWHRIFFYQSESSS